MRGTAMRRIGNGRVIAGFLIAPLIPGAIMLSFAVFAPLLRGETPELVHLGGPLVAGTIAFVTIAFYAAAMVIGLPSLLWWKRRVRLIPTAAFGAVGGAVGLPVVFFLMAITGNMGMADALHATTSSYEFMFWWLGPVGGLLIAVVFWLIARPDRLAL